MLTHLAGLVAGLASSATGADLMKVSNLLSDEVAEVERRIIAAEEQAAAAWSMCAALQKDLAELRQGTAEEIKRVDRDFAMKFAEFNDRANEEIQDLHSRLDDPERWRRD